MTAFGASKPPPLATWPGSQFTVRVPVTVVEQVESSGFGWTDAAIGALFGIGLALIGVIATVALRNRHGRIALGA